MVAAYVRLKGGALPSLRDKGANRAMELPSHTLYADLKNFGRISNRDAALALLDRKSVV